MSSFQNNVVGLHTKSVYESITAFFMKCSKKSENTTRVYGSAISRFFSWHCNKQLNELLESDLDVTNDRIIRYQDYLSNDLDHANSYVNTQLSAISSLYNHLQRNRFAVRADDLKVDPLPDESERHGELEYEEAEQMARLVLKQVKGQEKHCLIRMAYVTSFRISSLLNIEWTDIVYSEKDGCYLVTTIGKRRKRHTRPISAELYEELLKIKEQDYYQRYNDNKIFHLTEKTARTMIHNLCEEMGIPDERNIVFHSLRNVAAGFIRDNGGDIEAIREQLNHNGYGALKHYMHSNKDYANMPGLKMEQELDLGLFETLNREELLNIILSQQGSHLNSLYRAAEQLQTNKSQNIRAV
ncbi:tyrosine-type recombinase/integrase [Saccharibacillus deserti]|uniref:tyrosine-type recombinase/integrase n=1 Tax=Saccharibacillus deserti TaxID=1634444 RepID=UPI001557B241